VLIHSIQPGNFRNLDPARLEFSSHANFIYGKNGQGKTNLLEAIYWLLTLRPKRGQISESIKNTESSFKLESELTFNDLRHRVNLRIEGRSKKLLIDGTPPKRHRDYLQNVLVVDFFPEDLLILIMEPALRRRFIDLTSVQYDLTHEETLRRYKRLLEQRNRLLKIPGGPDRALLDSYDEPFSDAASRITFARLQLIGKLGEKTNSIFREGIGEKYEAALHYHPALESLRDQMESCDTFEPLTFKEPYLDALRHTRNRDIESGRTTVGPHRDEWGMTLDGKTVRSFASRGEVRSAMFALHLARFHVLAEKRGIKPVVLIDDVMSELDADRRARVIELLPPGQIFLTACDPPSEVDRILSNSHGDTRRFEMLNGHASPVD
jgi:DNA replication and repair protein RecF